MVTTQVQLLRTLQQLISDTERLIADRVVAYPRTRVLADLPGVGMINLAQLLAEVGPILDRIDSAERAATKCGAAPLTRASGKTSGVYFRWAANTRARKASPASPTTPGCNTPGPPSSAQTPAVAGNAIRTPLASSPEPRCASSCLLDHTTALRSQPSPHIHIPHTRRFLRRQPNLPAHHQT
jgi:hypothetical protein